MNDHVSLLLQGYAAKRKLAELFESEGLGLADQISAGPSLAGGLRVPTREAVGGVLRSLWRVILRRASIAPVMVGIAFSSSSGVRKRCAGSF